MWISKKKFEELTSRHNEDFRRINDLLLDSGIRWCWKEPSLFASPAPIRYPNFRVDDFVKFKERIEEYLEIKLKTDPERTYYIDASKK